MTGLALLFAATLSAGNAEFDDMAKRGAFDIAVGREKARLVAEGPAQGALTKAMLAKPEAFAKAGEAKTAAWEVYKAAIGAEFAALERAAGERLGITNLADAAAFSDADLARSKPKFEARYAGERKAACDEQAASLVGNVRPTAAEVETKDEALLKKEMSDKVAAQQKTAVFEENLGYISTKIVEPVIDAAKKERNRQGDYLRRAKSDAYAPSALTRDLYDKLVLNVKERKAKSDDLTMGWDIFPSVTNVTLRNAVHRRVLKRLENKVGEIPQQGKDGKGVKETIAISISSDRAKHRKEKESRECFRQAWTQDLRARALAAARDDAPEKERQELGDYLTKNASDNDVAKAIGKRIDQELMPVFVEVRRGIADAEFVKTWPTLADRTWFPDAETSDETSARSDFAAAVRAWREMPGLDLAKGDDALEESSARADKSVAAAFEIARGAVAAQTKIVDEVHPTVLGEAKENRDSFWSRTPDLGKVIEMLTEAVEKRWAETKVATLWPRGDAPKNADEQHAELFPSVKKRIELVAKTIMAEIDKPKPEDSQDETEEEMAYTITVSREGDRVTVKLDRGGSTLIKESAKAQMGDFRSAVNAVGEKLGKEILKLK